MLIHLFDNFMLFFSKGMDGTHVCLATSQQYMIVNSENNKTQDLFPYNMEHTNPYITCISKVNIEY